MRVLDRSRLEKLLVDEEKKFHTDHPKSYELYQRARKSLQHNKHYLLECQTLFKKKKVMTTSLNNMKLIDDDLAMPGQTWGLFLISALSLFLELLFIRWIGSEIRIFAYLQNTILIVCFLGLGLGMFTSSKPIKVRQSLIPMLILMTLMAIPVTRLAFGKISEMLSVLQDFLIWSPAVQSDSSFTLIYIFIGLALTYAALILIVDIFVPIGRAIGRLMNNTSNPIWGYSINIFGSVLGTWSFVLLGFFYQPPFVWFIVAGILLAFFVFWSNQDRRLNFALLAIILALSWFASQVSNAVNVIWSPYQKLVVQETRQNNIGDYIVWVNNTGYQAIIDLSDVHVSADIKRFSPDMKGLSQYDLPSLFHPNPKTFLIVGSGAGNDVAGVLRHEVQSITAVEIDPAIIKIGREFHPEKPYSSPKVRVVNDDARSFFSTSNEKYDVIIFGLLDSHTTVAMTNARLDHYVYTRESIARAKSMLNDGGVMVLTFEATSYIADRINASLEEIFDQPPLVFRIPSSSYGWGGVMFVTGDTENIKKQLDANQRLSSYIAQLKAASPIYLTHDTKITTDDWPYIYLKSPKIPVLYHLLVGLVSLIFVRSYKTWQAADKGVFRMSRTFWHFFTLGSAFLLLEVQNISKAAVVLGNTWQVNAVIITGVLGMALLANWVVHKFPKMKMLPVYTLLIGSCLVLYFVDLASFGFLPYAAKAAIVGALTSLPMFFSGIIFTRSFAVTRDKSNALGANLIGALLGALLQSITFITGIKALLLVVACFYLLALITIPTQSVGDASKS